MSRRARELAAPALGALMALALLALWLVATLVLVGSTLPAEQRDALQAWLAPRVPLVVMSALVLAALVAAISRRLYRRWAGASTQLLEQARVLSGTDTQRALTSDGAAPLQGLARVINELVQQREQLRGDMAARVAQASRNVEQERSRLAALMSELTQSVVVCNLDGRILLYNNRARVQFRALADSPAQADGTALIGLGRSIYSAFDRRLIAHALENIQHRMLRGAASPTAQFITTTRSGRLLRVQMAPVRSVEPDPGPTPHGGQTGLSGFVLMLDNITSDFEQESARDQLLHGLTEGSRSSLGNMQAAIEVLDDAAPDSAMRERLHRVIRDEVHAMSERVRTLAAQSAQAMKTRWPLEDMLGADLVAAAVRRIEAAGLRAGLDEVDASLWLKVDSFSLLQALGYLAARLHEEYAVELVLLRLAPAGARAHLDLLWSGQAMSTETVTTWEIDPIRIGQETGSISVRDVVQRHGGEFWFERERVRHRAFFRFLLPLAGAHEELDAATFVHHDSRPEYYDFDLFNVTEQSIELDERRLAELSYTVFDTETTGLEPSAGDEIIQIGAVRLVNGRLLRSESFERLVDPQRPIPPQSIPIHGIEPHMVAGQPTIDVVLPAFHAFAQDTVLVAHNAAFDMRFLQLKEERTGLRFDQPVLDTLLLSALVHPNQESHRLEAIAERLGVTVIGRHTALGDAMVTAEIFLKLVALLAEQGIHTLGQARRAAQQTYYARIKY